MNAIDRRQISWSSLWKSVGPKLNVCSTAGQGGNYNSPWGIRQSEAANREIRQLEDDIPASEGCEACNLNYFAPHFQERNVSE